MGVILSSRTRNAAKIAVALSALAVSSWYVAETFQWLEILRVLCNVNPFWLLLAALSIPLYWLTRTLRWMLLLNSMNVLAPFADLYMCSAVCLGLATVTPVQSGEILKVEMVRGRGNLGRAAGYGSFLVERVADLAAVVLIAVLGLLWMPQLVAYRQVFLALSLTVLIAIVLGVLLLGNVTLPGRTAKLQSEIRKCAKHKRTLFALGGLTFLGWGPVAMGWYTSLLSLHIAVSYVDVAVIMSFVALAGVLSFLPGAVGVSEAGISFFLLEMGHAAPQAQAGAMIVRFYGIIVLALAAVHWVIWMRVRRSAHRGATQSPS